MPTQAQVTANKANAQHSTGAKTEAGKAASSRNHLSHGLTGTEFALLEWEDPNAFTELSARLELEHKPATVTESILIQNMAQAYWLTQRAIALQGTCFSPEIAPDNPEKHLALYLRYQTTHDRAFHKNLNQFLKLRAERRKAEIGFESQKHREAQQQAQLERQKARADREKANEDRRQAAEKRRQNRHESNLRLAEAKTWCREAQAVLLETDAAIAEVAAERAAKAKTAA